MALYVLSDILALLSDLKDFTSYYSILVCVRIISCLLAKVIFQKIYITMT